MQIGRTHKEPNGGRWALGITIRHHSASLVMPISDPRDRFFYLHHTPMNDTYYLTHVISPRTG